MQWESYLTLMGSLCPELGAYLSYNSSQKLYFLNVLRWEALHAAEFEHVSISSWHPRHSWRAPSPPSRAPQRDWADFHTEQIIQPSAFVIIYSDWSPWLPDPPYQHWGIHCPAPPLSHTLHSYTGMWSFSKDTRLTQTLTDVRHNASNLPLSRKTCVDNAERSHSFIHKELAEEVSLSITQPCQKTSERSSEKQFVTIWILWLKVNISTLCYITDLMGKKEIEKFL